MYANTQAGQATIAAVATATLSAHRRAIMDMLVGSPVITTAEYDTAMQRTLACQDVATLQKWYRNTVREIANREEAVGLANMAQGIERFEARLLAARQEAAPVQYATAEQAQEVTTLANSVWILRKEKTQALLLLPTLTHVGATTLIGQLWAKVLRRQERAAEGHADAAASYSSAA